MRGAFIVQLRKATPGSLEGSIEEVDTGEQAKFHSESELIGFLRERFAWISRADPKLEGKK